MSLIDEITKDENSIFTHSFEKIITVLQDIILGHWNQVKNKLHTIEWEVSKHLEGIFIVPILVAFGMSRAHSIIFANKNPNLIKKTK